MRILIVADERGWIFERHATEIKNRLTEHTIDIAYCNDNIKEMSKNYDCVYVMDPMPLKYGYPPQEKTIIGLRCEYLYKDHPEGATGLYENGFIGRCVSIKDKCSLFHVVNRNQLSDFEAVVTDKPLMLVQHGVNTEVFNRDLISYCLRCRGGNLRVGFAGRVNHPNQKGVDLIYNAGRKTSSIVIDQSYGRGQRVMVDMPQFYELLDVYVCMSLTEGLNNSTMEAGAMGVPVISTRSGAAEEMIVDGENGILIDRNEDALKDALNKMKSDDLREKLGQNLKKEIVAHWSWDVKIDDFRRMFREFERV